MSPSRSRRPQSFPLRRAAITCALAAATLLLPRAGRAQESWRAHADLTRLRQAVDSFDVVVGGNVIGSQRLGWMREGDSWVMSDEIVLPGVRQRSEVRVSSRLVEQGLRQEGEVGRTPMRIALDRRNDRFVGTASTPTGGAMPTTIDVAATDDVIDDNALSVVLPAIRWREGLAFSVPVLASGKGTIDRFAATVTARGSTTVPAGTFDVWRVQLVGATYALEAEVTATPPYRVVRFGPRGARMSAQLRR